MNESTGIIIGIVALIIVGGIYVSASNKGNMTMDDQNDNSTMMQKEGDPMIKKDDPVQNEEMEETNKGMVKSDAMSKGSYEMYTPDKIARAQKGDVVLFFHASWCPSCRGLDADIQANMSSIPEGVTILKADYDKEIELKKKYGVTSQHTLVQVDKDGNLIKKWSGGAKLSDLLSQVN